MKNIIYVCLLSLCLALTGCGAFIPDTSTDTDSASPETPDISLDTSLPEDEIEPSYSGVLTIATRKPTTLNPILNPDTSVDQMLRLVFEPLFNIDDNFNLVPNLATSYEAAPDGLSAVITLNASALWSDGTPVTSSDFIFTVQAIKNSPDGSIYKTNADNILSCEEIDNSTVQITFGNFYGAMKYMFTFPLIPAHYYAGETDPASAANMQPLGNGAYEFTSYEDLKEITFSASNSGKKPYIQEIKALILPDAETELDAFNSGIIDVLSIDFAKWSKTRSGKTVKAYQYNTTLYDFVGFNFNNFNLKNKNLREVVARCIDKDSLIVNAYLGSALKTNTPVNSGAWFYNPAAAEYTLDLAKAESLLYDGGFTKEQTGIYAPTESGGSNQLRLRLLVNTENDERVKIADNLKENLNSLGIVVDYEKLTFEEYSQKLTAKDFDIVVGGFNLAVCPDLTFAFHSLGTAGGGNFFSYASPELDEALQKAFLASDDTAFNTAISEVQRHITEELAAVSVAYRKNACLTDEGVYGDILPMVNNMYANIEKWYVGE
ncbi:MAG: peptide ABC transporter substrate-binding protein [Clostridiales bacterium]|jgi:peptide/nickel transport system substrate-binding protein|nr:peptide ABC transporter substrate-binding protein [Clostridiales bacterium]